MQGKFLIASEAERDELDWGTMTWISRPQTTGAKDLVAIEVNLMPGEEHDFHNYRHISRAQSAVCADPRLRRKQNLPIALNCSSNYQLSRLLADIQ